MKKVFITGANGFVGRHLQEQLQTNYIVLAGTHSETKNCLQVDVEQPGKIYQTLKSTLPDVIVHLAAHSSIGNGSPERIFAVNFNGTLNLYEAVLKIRRECSFDPKIIYVSSAQVYGKALYPQKIDETVALLPMNFYATSKVAADRLTYQYSQCFFLKTVILRPFNHTGTGQGLGFFVSDMASQIARIENDASLDTLSVGDLTPVRDYLDVVDVVTAYQAVIEMEVSPGEVFNICSGRGYPMQQILDTLLKLANKKIKVKVDQSKFRMADIPILVGDNRKFTKHFSWKPRVSIDKTLESVLNYWRSRQPHIQSKHVLLKD